MAFDVVGLKQADAGLFNLEETIQNAKSKYDKSMQGFTKKNVPKVGAICKEYPVHLQDLCRKTAKKYANVMIREAKVRAEELKDQITEQVKELKAKRGEKREMMNTVRDARKDYPEEFEEYKKSTYYKLKECEKTWKETPNLDEFLTTQPGFYRAKELEDTIREELVTIESQIKSDVTVQSARIRSYQKLLKTDLNPLESQVVRKTINNTKTQLDKTKKRNVKWLKRLTNRAKYTIKRLQSHQKNAKKEIKNSIKDYTKNEKSEFTCRSKIAQNGRRRRRRIDRNLS